MAAGKAGEHGGEVVVLADGHEVDREAVELARTVFDDLDVHRRAGLCPSTFSP